MTGTEAILDVHLEEAYHALYGTAMSQSSLVTSGNTLRRSLTIQVPSLSLLTAVPQLQPKALSARAEIHLLHLKPL